MCVCSLSLSSYKAMMNFDKTMDEKEIRGVLKPFCDLVGREVKPVPLDKAGLLVEFMGMNASFLKIREEIAKTHVGISRARRPGSSTRHELEGLQERLIRLESDRQRVISMAASSDEFLSFQKSEIEKSKQRLAEWTAAQDIAARARVILANERLPKIIRPSEITALSVLTAVENHVEAAPPPGSLILMGEQPRPKESDFEPASAYASGLSHKFFNASIRLNVAIESDRGRQAEVDGAIVARDALVMRINDKRRPVDERHWDLFDDILPFAARKEILPIIPTCLPYSSPYSVLRTLLSNDSWRAIRNSANDRNNGICVSCGHSSAGEVHAEWQFLEPLRHSGAFGIQKLIDVRPYCSSCSMTLFPQPDKLVVPAVNDHERRNIFVVNPVMRRLGIINRWDDDASPDPVATSVSIAQSAYQRRSRIRWALDLSILHGINVSLHPDMVMNRKGWIMKKDDVPLFEDGKSVHLTRIFGAAFMNTDGKRVYFDVPPIHFVPWNTSVDDFWSETPDDNMENAALLSVATEDEEFAGPLDPDEEDYIEEEGMPFSMV